MIRLRDEVRDNYHCRAHRLADAIVDQLSPFGLEALFLKLQPMIQVEVETQVDAKVSSSRLPVMPYSLARYRSTLTI